METLPSPNERAAAAPNPLSYAPAPISPRRPSLLANYIWLAARNLVGWILILSSWALGIISPIPIGFVLFLIGFSLIWFPGKRRMTARLLRGSPVAQQSRTYVVSVTAATLIIPTIVVIWLSKVFHIPYHLTAYTGLIFGSVYFVAGVVTIVFTGPIRRTVNSLLRLMPKARRRARPWLRKRGIDLLPPRRRSRRTRPGGPVTRAPDKEIIEIAPRYGNRARKLWEISKPWLRGLAAFGITAAIFVWMFKPVVGRWDQVHERVQHTEWVRVLLASTMFSLFLFVFRVLSWKRIVSGLGYKLPLAATTRIWSTSELARYLPGVIWQVVGRVYLVRPYGVSGAVCSASQVLELIIFLLANVLVAVTCLAWFGFKQMHHTARGWLICAIVLVPVLLFLIHPRVFYRALNGVLRRLGKPQVERKLGSRILAGLLGWAILGLLWQSLAIWIITSGPLELKLAKWWVVAGAYCLAWCAGFLAFWAPGGLGVRELVFVAAMQVALPASARAQFDDPRVLLGFLAFLSVLLRVWATAGELLLAGISYAADFRGAVGRSDAPGRINLAAARVREKAM